MTTALSFGEFETMRQIVQMHECPGQADADYRLE